MRLQAGLILATVVALLTFASSSNAQIVNGGFELLSGNGANVQATGWTRNADVAYPPGGNGGVGNYAQVGKETGVLSQVFTVASAGLYVIDFYVKAVNSENATGTVIAEITQGLNSFITLLSGSGNKFDAVSTVQANLVAGSATITFRNATGTSGGNSFIGMGIDEVSVRPVPAPIAGAGLLSLLACSLFVGAKFARRRQSRRA
ncbi:hypothetical protein [uncultured Alsobacter sp.]|uniref:hypothetical protein n=1 Tax=uncultured Alsobacter sp. TaxID=1748258 RepID=UPI0025E0AE81|nr:hypothetical protein [uncultured Alsobacter sp.]